MSSEPIPTRPLPPEDFAESDPPTLVGAGFGAGAGEVPGQWALIRYVGNPIGEVLPETDMAGARLLAERLLAATGLAPFDVGSESLTITCSIGVAQRLDEDRDGGTLLARADSALYAAKAAGRNQVVADPAEA